MKKDVPSRLVPVFLCLCAVLMRMQLQAQAVTVKGIVSTPAGPVRSASVSFQVTGDPGNTHAAVTDSTGRYQVSLILTSVAPGTALPTTFALAQNYPNPFSSSTTISYDLKTQANTRVAIYDILGRVVRETVVGVQSVGSHRILWDGSNTTGQKVAPGVYFYILRSGGESQAKKMMYRGAGDGIAPSPQTFSPPTGDDRQAMQRQLMQGNYTVLIDNTSTTSPSIITRQIDNVIFESDTTLDVLVDSQTAIPVAAVYSDSVQQYIRGFGAANILPWRPDMTAAQVQKGFGAGDGQIGFSMLRLRIPYTDDVNEFSAQVPTAALAHSLGAIVFATPWTPPPAMKSTNNIVGGMLNDSSYAAYAAHLKGFADFMTNNGAPLYAVSIQNEPDASVTYESCSWNATQFLNFTKNDAASIGARIIMPESESFVHSLSDSTLNDSSAASNVSIIGGHIYGSGLAPYPLAVSKGKEMWMTEHLVLDTTWTAVLGTGREIHDCMNAGMNAYVWWYIVRYYGPIGDDGNVTKRGFVMSQYARFVRPGYYKIKCNAQPQRNVWVSSYKDGTSARVVLVALNTGTSAVQQAFAVTHGSMSSFSSYTTSATKSCLRGADIPAAHGAFTATLDPSSIMTFVSQ